MKQAIAGVTPADVAEATVMVVWPSNAAYGPGRFMGRLYAIDAGFYVLTVGNLLALLSIPAALVVYFWRLLPFQGCRYRLTNRRIIVERGIVGGTEEKSLFLDRFDEIEIAEQPGQAWYRAGDLVFRQGKSETFRLAGVSRPESFRQVCLKSRQAYVGVKEALERQTVTA